MACLVASKCDGTLEMHDDRIANTRRCGVSDCFPQISTGGKHKESEAAEIVSPIHFGAWVSGVLRGVIPYCPPLGPTVIYRLLNFLGARSRSGCAD